MPTEIEIIKARFDAWSAKVGEFISDTTARLNEQDRRADEFRHRLDDAERMLENLNAGLVAADAALAEYRATNGEVRR